MNNSIELKKLCLNCHSELNFVGYGSFFKDDYKNYKASRGIFPVFKCPTCDKTIWELEDNLIVKS